MHIYLSFFFLLLRLKYGKMIITAKHFFETYSGADVTWHFL